MHYLLGVTLFPGKLLGLFLFQNTAKAVIDVWKISIVVY